MEGFTDGKTCVTGQGQKESHGEHGGCAYSSLSLSGTERKSGDVAHEIQEAMSFNLASPLADRL